MLPARSLMTKKGYPAISYRAYLPGSLNWQECEIKIHDLLKMARLSNW